MAEQINDESGAPKLPFGMDWRHPSVDFTANPDYDPQGHEWPHRLTLDNYDFSDGQIVASLRFNLANDAIEEFEIELRDTPTEGETGHEVAIGSLAQWLLGTFVSTKHKESSELVGIARRHKLASRIKGVCAGAGFATSLVAIGIAAEKDSAPTFQLGMFASLASTAIAFASLGRRQDAASTEIIASECQRRAGLAEALVSDIEANGITIVAYNETSVDE